jgi:hypothetical protein
MEQNGISPPPQPEFAERPNESEVKFYAGVIGLAEWKALDWLDEMRGGGWLDYQHRAIGDWRACLRRVKTKWEADGRPKTPPVARQSPVPTANNGAELILRQNELKRVEERMRVIKGSYEQHSTWDEDHRKEYAKLRDRKKELITMLGLTV